MSKTEEHAIRSLRILVQHVFDNSQDGLFGITYSELARRIGRLNKHGHGHGHGMGKVMGHMGRSLRNLQMEWNEQIPQLQSLVISKTGMNKNLPDDGIKEFLRDYQKLTKREKVNVVQAEYEKIRAFGSRWNKVLLKLGLEEVSGNSVQLPVETHPRGGGGESPQHKALKHYIVSHPELLGIEQYFEPSPEYILPTRDKIDVLFRSEGKCIAVEVKSRVSDNLEQDYERGLYQCVKYKALLEAMVQDPEYTEITGCVKSILALETTLPDKYRNLSVALGVEVIEGMGVREARSNR